MNAERLFVIRRKNDFVVASTDADWTERHFSGSAKAHCYVANVMRDELIEAKAEIERLKNGICDLELEADEMCRSCEWCC